MTNTTETGEHHTCGGRIVESQASGVPGMLCRACLQCQAYIYSDHPCWPMLPNGEDVRENVAAWQRSDRASPCADPVSFAAREIARRWEQLGPVGRTHVEAILTRVERAQRTAEAERVTLRIVE